MKKAPKLTLNRETLRRLDDLATKAAVGGKPTLLPTCPPPGSVSCTCND